MIGIYKIKNVASSKVYIGQSIKVENRLLFHQRRLRENNHSNTVMQNSWNKWGPDNFVFEIVEECNECDLNRRENHWCKVYKSHDRKYGYNLTITTDSNKYRLTDEGRAKIGNAHRGRRHTDETKKTISLANKGKKLSDETRRKMSEAFYNGKRSITMEQMQAQGRRLAEMQRGKPIVWTENRIKGKLKPVFSYDIRTQEINRYPSIKEAQKYNSGTNCSNIIISCKNKSRLAADKIWSYKEDDLLCRLPFINKKTMKRIENKVNPIVKNRRFYPPVICRYIKTGKIERFDNATKASNEMSISKRKILRNIHRGTKTVEWKYVFDYEL